MITLDRTKAPQFNELDELTFIHPETHFLANGVKVNVLSGGSQEIVKIDFIFKAGTYHQTKPLVASATNNLLKEGTKNYSAFEIADGIDQYGAYLQTNVDFDDATITLYTLNMHLKSVLDYFKEVVVLPAFDQNEFNIYMNNALEKFKVSMEKVSYVARKESMQQIFGSDNPYGANATIKDFEKITREDVIEFHHNFYRLSNCEIIVAGKVTTECIDLLNHFFGDVVPSETTHANIPLENKTNEQPEKIFIKKENSLQSAIRIGKQFPNKLHSDYFGLQILNTILGGYFGSRLMKNIREEKGYTYGVGSGIISLQKGGFFFISTEVGSAVTSDALIEIYKEIELLKTEKISLEELTLVKNYLLGKLLKSCDGPFNIAEMFENVYFYGLDYDFYNRYIQKIKSITAEELKDLANKYLINLKETVVGTL
ncbi:MAG: insulinase family protein [Bacteroidetes bacterium]|nr:insulinase family protein [Bacteroidota bacterium]